MEITCTQKGGSPRLIANNKAPGWILVHSIIEFSSFEDLVSALKDRYQNRSPAWAWKCGRPLKENKKIILFSFGGKLGASIDQQDCSIRVLNLRCF
jgi:hypothetical protein